MQEVHSTLGGLAHCCLVEIVRWNAIALLQSVEHAQSVDPYPSVLILLPLQRNAVDAQDQKGFNENIGKFIALLKILACNFETLTLRINIAFLYLGLGPLPGGPVAGELGVILPVIL